MGVATNHCTSLSETTDSSTLLTCPLPKPIQIRGWNRVVIKSSTGVFRHSLLPNDYLSTGGEKNSRENDLIVLYQLDSVRIPWDPSPTYLINGVILLPMSHEKYKSLKIPVFCQDNLKQVKNYLKDWILSRKLFPSYFVSLFAELNLYLDKIPIQHLFFLAPNLFSQYPRKFVTLVKFTTIWWIMDDFFSKCVADAAFHSYNTPIFTDPDFFTDVARVVKNIMTDAYNLDSAVPSFEISLIQDCLKALFEVYQDMKETAGTYDNENWHFYLLREMIEWINYYKLAYKNKQSSILSDLIYIPGRRFNGRRCILEMIQLLNGAFPREFIRLRNKLFEVFYDTGILIHNLALDIFYLKQDIVSDKCWKNVILRNVRFQGQSFQQSFRNVQDMLNRSVVDFTKMGERLMEDYSKDKELHNFVMNYLCFVDGGIRGLVENHWGNGSHVAEEGGCLFQINQVDLSIRVRA